MNRRAFLQHLMQTGVLAAGSGLAGALLAAEGRKTPRYLQFEFAQMQYRGGDWDPRPMAVPRGTGRSARWHGDACRAGRTAPVGRGQAPWR